MSTTAWRIKDWGARRGKHRLFECAQSKKYDKPAWLPLPINLSGDGFRTLMSTREGQSAFGVFVSLCELTAHLPVRGCILSAQGAFTLRALCAKTGVPVADLEAAIAVLESPEIGWLQRLSDRQVKAVLREIKREQSGSNLPDSYAPEQEAEQEQEQELEQESASKQGNGSRGSLLASARSPDPVFDILSRIWKRDHAKARRLAAHPNATRQRVEWLGNRIIREKPTRPHGFMEKGIVQGWAIDPTWLAQWTAHEERLNGHAPARERLAGAGAGT